MKKNFLFTLNILIPSLLIAQAIEVNPPNDIKTINFGRSDSSYGLPIVNLNEKLYLEFDVLNNLEEDFYYVIEHFDYDWTPSQLMKTEYLSGMDNLRIVDYVNFFQYLSNLLSLQTSNTKLSNKIKSFRKLHDQDI